MEKESIDQDFFSLPLLSPTKYQPELKISNGQILQVKEFVGGV